MTNVSTIEGEAATGVAGAVAVAGNVQEAVASQTGLLNQIEAGMNEFLSIAPTVAGAIDPAIAGASTAVATMLKTLLNAFQEFHAATVVPAANAAASAAKPA